MLVHQLLLRLRHTRFAIRQEHHGSTRPANVGGEAIDAVTEQEFAQHVANQTFVLHWQAHGLRYGIPHKQLSCLARGDDALVNLSRGVLKTADQ